MPDSATSTFRSGLLFGLTAYGLWGAMPLYLRTVKAASAWELLAHRILWSMLLLLLCVTLLRRWRDVGHNLRHRKVLALLALSTVCIGCNWFLFIYGVAHQQIVQTSLGYFITPLVNLLFGMLMFGERLRSMQWLAVALAVVGVLVMAVMGGQWPVLALGLAGSFGMYGMLRKAAPVDGLVGMTIETMLLGPAAAGLLFYLGLQGNLLFGQQGPRMDALLAFSGVMTTVPLLCFVAAARRLPLSVLGFLQYLSPSVQFLQAVFLFGEPFSSMQLASFSFIWTGLVIFSIDLIRQHRAPVVMEFD